MGINRVEGGGDRRRHEGKGEKRSKKKEEGFSRRGGCRGCVRAQAEDVIETSTSTVNTGGGPVGGGNA